MISIPVVQSETADRWRDLRLDRALVGQEDFCRAAFNEGGRDRACLDIGE
jgi:hypothetical protein